jgi:ATP-dependent Clp protease ATP-binding subunit ClpA
MFGWFWRLFEPSDLPREPRYERFTDRARRVMKLANREAQRFNHEYIGTEHILLGLIKEGSGVAAEVLQSRRIRLADVRREVEKIVQHGPGGEQVVMGRLPHTPRAKKVVEFSIEEARNLNHNYVGTEHLLLGLLREQDGVAAAVLTHFGLTFEDARAQVIGVLSRTPLPQPIEPTPLNYEQFQLVRDRIRQLREQADALAAQDPAGAKRCRAEVDTLQALLAWYEEFHRDE